MKPLKLHIIVPCYNEEECLRETTRRLNAKIDNLIKKRIVSKESKIIYVDDGSSDETWRLIRQFDERVVGLKLAHNRGHQNALLCGLMYSIDKCDITISMDADLQDDIDVVDDFIANYQKGCDIVYGVRNNRDTDSFFKRFTAQAFYRIMGWLGAETIYNSADYRLMSNCALRALAEYDEVNLYLRGIIPTLGFRTTTVCYRRAERFAGESKYPFKKMLKLAIDGITSFSIKPIHMVSLLGLLIFFISLLFMIYAVVVKCTGGAVDGWTFIIVSIWLLGGLQMASIGLIGEYIGKTYAESKRRPRYYVEEIKESTKG